MSKFGVIDINNVPNNDLYNVFDAKGNRLFNNFADIKKFIDKQSKKNPLAFQWCNEVGLPNYRNRDFDTFANNRLTSIVDIVDLLDSQSYKRYTLSVVDTQGDEHRGRVAGLLALRNFEIEVGSEIQSMVSNSAFMRFCYDYEVDFKSKELKINLSDLHPEGSKTEYKTIQWYVENAQGTEAKQKLFINDKFKNVEIEIDFS